MNYQNNNKVNGKIPQIKNGIAAFLRFIKHIKLPTFLQS